MTGDTKHRNFKDQLESEIADMERDASEDPEKYNGPPWWCSASGTPSEV